MFLSLGLGGERGNGWQSGLGEVSFYAGPAPQRTAGEGSFLGKEVAFWPSPTSPSSRKLWDTWRRLALARSGLDYVRLEEGRWSLEDGMGPASIS